MKTVGKGYKLAWKHIPGNTVKGKGEVLKGKFRSIGIFKNKAWTTYKTKSYTKREQDTETPNLPQCHESGKEQKKNDRK